jgi:hypothetical protein
LIHAVRVEWSLKIPVGSTEPERRIPERRTNSFYSQEKLFNLPKIGLEDGY